MTVAPDQVVTIRYTLRVEGEVVDQGELPYLHGHHNLLEALEEALEGHEPGDQVRVHLSPEEAYGVRDPEAVAVLELDRFPEEVEVVPGAQFYAEGSDGEARAFTVVSVEGNEVHVDFNHPLAGATLDFEVEVTGVRPATPEELAHGHVHG